MSREAFIDRKFTAGSLFLIEKANEIIADYQRQGFTLTLRQLYYQFVSRLLLPNRQTEYKRLGSIINDARLAGLVDWAAIEDRTRNVRGGDWGYGDPAAAIRSLAEGYQERFWVDQDRHVEVWIEKDALIGVVEPVCERWRLPYLGCRGYISQSEQYTAGQRFAALAEMGRKPVVLYLGDHDPSGIDMTRDHRDRLAMFARWPVEVRRLALNYDQIEEYDPPPNPTKDTDSRSGKRDPETDEFPEGSYGRMMEDQGADPETCWELDALDPNVIDQLIEDEVQGLVDHDVWAESEAHQERNRRILTAVHERWSEVEDFIGPLDDDDGDGPIDEDED